MRKNKITTGLALLGVLGMSATASGVYAADTNTDVDSGQVSNFSGESRFKFGHGPGPGSTDRGHGPMTAEDIQEMSEILANNDFSAFLEKMSEDRPEEAVDPTVEQIEELQDRFDHMVEMYNSGETPRGPGKMPGEGRGHRGGPFGDGLRLGQNKDELSKILVNNNFDAFVALVEENKPADAPEITDEMSERLQKRFDRMVERYKNGEMPWQQDREVENN